MYPRPWSTLLAWLRVTLLKNGMLNGLVLALMIAYVTVWDCQRLQPYAEFGSARRKPNGLCAPDLPEILYQSDREISRKKLLT